MTIYLGTLTDQGNGVVSCDQPVGFNSAYALRLTSFCTAPLIVQNLLGTDPNQQYIQPNQQMVWQVQNVGRPVTLTLTPTLTVGEVLANVTAEWSTDPQTDFRGVYPSQVNPPFLFRQIQLFTTTFLSPGDQSPPINVEQYSSLLVMGDGTRSPSGFILNYQFFDEAGNECGFGSLSSPGEALGGIPGANIAFPPYVIPVTGSVIVFTNESADPFTIIVDGTNRTATRTELADDNLGITSYFLGPQAFVAGTLYVLGAFDPPRGDGECTIEAAVGGSTTLTGFFSIDQGLGAYEGADLSYPVLSVADTTELVTRANGDKTVSKVIKLPQVYCLITFSCVTDDPDCTVYLRIMG